jgi:hypothetical protein
VSVVQDVKIKTIEKYLVPLPDSAVDQVISFVSYLNFMQNIENDYPYPDEQFALEEYHKNPGKLSSWDAVKADI